MVGFVSSAFGVESGPLSSREKAVCSPRHHLPKRLMRCVRMAAEGGGSGEETYPKLKEFLADTKDLGRLRIIARNDAAVMESISTTQKLFYATLPNGVEYGNIIDPQIDLHIKLSGISHARFETGVSRTPSKAPTYAIRMTGTDPDFPLLTFFLQWDKTPEDVEEDRVKAWTAMKEKYTPNDTPFQF